MALPYPVTDCWDLIDRAPLQVRCKVSVSLQMQMLREIASYLLKGNQCFASDEHFATKFRVSIAQIKNAYRALREQGVVHFVEQPRAGMRGRGSRAKLKVIDWGQLSLMVARDQRLTSDRPTANQHTDQRLTISPNSLETKKEDQQTTETAVVVAPSLENSDLDDSWLFRSKSDHADWTEVQKRLAVYPVAAHKKAVAMAKSRGDHPSKIGRMIDHAKRKGVDGSYLFRWIELDSAPPDDRKINHNLHSLPAEAQREGWKLIQKVKDWGFERTQAAIADFEKHWQTKEASA